MSTLNGQRTRVHSTFMVSCHGNNFSIISFLIVEKILICKSVNFSQHSPTSIMMKRLQLEEDSWNKNKETQKNIINP